MFTFLPGTACLTCRASRCLTSSTRFGKLFKTSQSLTHLASQQSREAKFEQLRLFFVSTDVAFVNTIDILKFQHFKSSTIYISEFSRQCRSLYVLDILFKKKRTKTISRRQIDLNEWPIREKGATAYELIFAL